MSASVTEVRMVGEGRIPLSVCTRCGRQVRLDGSCECDAIFFALEDMRERV